MEAERVKAGVCAEEGTVDVVGYGPVLIVVVAALPRDAVQEVEPILPSPF